MININKEALNRIIIYNKELLKNGEINNIYQNGLESITDIVIFIHALLQVGYSVDDILSKIENIRIDSFSVVDVEFLVIPKNIKVIHSFAFERNRTLEELIVLPGCKKIESYAFRDCENLKKVYISKDTIVEKKAFENCNNIEVYKDNMETEDFNHFILKSVMRKN